MFFFNYAAVAADQRERPVQLLTGRSAHSGGQSMRRRRQHAVRAGGIPRAAEQDLQAQGGQHHLARISQPRHRGKPPANSRGNQSLLIPQ